MIFCARYEYDSEKGFWPTFLRRIGLPNEPNIQNTCRKRFKKACQQLKPLYFPSEGYVCVTPILYHAIIPQSYVQEMARFLRKIEQSVGWDSIAEMEIEQLESQLSEWSVRLHSSKILFRFISQSSSRRLATQLVHNLCEHLYLYKRGEFLEEEIEELLEGHPVQKEIWKALSQNLETEVLSPLSINVFAPLRWRWDIKSRRLQIYFPRQKISSFEKPTSLMLKKQRYNITAKKDNDRWLIESSLISEVPIDLRIPSRFTVELRDEREYTLRRWNMAPLKRGVMFFRPNAMLTIGSHVNAEKGLTRGEWLILLHKNLHLCDESGNVKPERRWHSPQGFEEHEAFSAFLQPPIRVVNSSNVEIAKFPLDIEENCRLQLTGNLLDEADELDGIPVFTERAPELIIKAESQEEVTNFQLLLRPLSKSSHLPAKSFPIKGLISDGVAEWSSSEKGLRVLLDKLLPTNAIGRFRLKVLHGIQSARYAPEEFILAPRISISPSSQDIEHKLFTAKTPPDIQISCGDFCNLTSESGKVIASSFYEHQLLWTGYENVFKAELSFDDLKIPLQWRFHILRAGIASANTQLSWLVQPITLPQEGLNFSHTIHIEGLPNDEYEICIGESKSKRGRFDNNAHISFPLAEFSDSVRRCSEPNVAIAIKVFADNEEYRLALLNVLKPSNGMRRYAGELIEKLNTGQRVLHRDYGLGILEAFVEKVINGESLDMAQFHFLKFDGVQIFIPTSRQLPIFWGLHTSFESLGV